MRHILLGICISYIGHGILTHLLSEGLDQCAARVYGVCYEVVWKCVTAVAMRGPAMSVWFVFQDGKIEAEDFTSRLYRELNSSPQPYLVPFLKVIDSLCCMQQCGSIRGGRHRFHLAWLGQNWLSCSSAPRCVPALTHLCRANAPWEMACFLHNPEDLDIGASWRCILFLKCIVASSH